MLQTIVPESSSISALKAVVGLYDGSTLLKTCTSSDYLQDFSLYREGDTGKFFGFGISHKLLITFIDTDRNLAIYKGNNIKIDLGNGEVFDRPFPTLYITEVEREEKSNNITCTAVDIIQAANGILATELNLVAPYTLRDVAIKAATLLGLEVTGMDDTFDLSFAEGGNFLGDETLRDILNAIAEATQTIYYINNENKLVFKRLDRDGVPVFTIAKKDYYELTTQTTITLSKICHTTELGDNLYSGDDTGVTQYIRDNPFWTNRLDVGTLLDNALARTAGTTLAQLECEWIGNYLLEIGDKIAVVTEDNNTVNTYLFDDVIDYAGYINQITSWEFTQDEATTAANPTSIGEKINQTFAKVDKVNKEITLMAQEVTDTKSGLAELKLTTDDITLRVENIENSEVNIENDANFIALKERVGALEVSDTEIKASVSSVESTLTTKINTDVGNLETSLKGEIKAGDDELGAEITTVKSNVSALQVESAGISASVKSLETKTDNSLNAMDNTITALSKEVNLKMTSEEVNISINKALENGIDKVKTTYKNYTFDDAGLNISNSDSEFNTKITENGMRIYKYNQEVLTANNEGVTAADLHARTFLIIGENSRLEDRGNRTACFWIGHVGG